MRASDVISIAFRSLAQHKLRTTLTMLGMMFGVAAVIAMLSIGAGAEQQALAQIDRMGTRNVLVTNKKLEPAELAEIRKKSLGLSLRDIEAIQEAVPGVAFVLPRYDAELPRVIAAGVKTHARAVGVSARHRETTPLVLGEGRFFDARDELHAAQTCVIGDGVRRALFSKRAIGQDIKLGSLWCEVIGVVAPDAANDDAIYLPFTTAHAKLERDPGVTPLGALIVHLRPTAPATEATAAIAALLDRLHGGQRDYDIVVPELLLEHSRQTRRLFDLVMGLIAGISLIVGGVGIVNVMLASVLEQTREIGVRRALGARRSEIQVQFLATAFALAVIGGGLGLLLGVGIARGVAAYAAWPTLVTLSSIALSLGVSVVVGVASGFYPAARAARLDPIEALAA